ncbi:MAG: response regulator [Anaerolineae bacterium]|nr:response regulator [Anaerolineae bacterium]
MAKKILIADDEPQILNTVGAYLEKDGYTVISVRNGQEALYAFRHEKPDLVILDVMMPEMDGLEATKAIRNLQSPHGKPRIIALTANAQQGDREMCLSAGMDDYLPKPVTQAGLQGKLMLATVVSPNLVPRLPESEMEKDELSVFDEATYRELLDAIHEDGMNLVLTTFNEDAPKRIEAMRNAAREGDNSAVKTEVHAIKSSAGSLGFCRLSQVAKRLEGECLGMSWPSLFVGIDEVAAALDEVLTIGREKMVGLVKSASHSKGIKP